ncbi:hypothetical protein [Reyranella sp.]|uniref:hypothetical protein n=1 Tax=Reyranella sp. TaxID=1929291 RepID=UPI003BAB3572
MTCTLLHESIDFLAGNRGLWLSTLVARTGTARPPVKATPTRCASGPATNRRSGRVAIGKGLTRLPDQPAILPTSAIAARAGPRARPRARVRHRTLKEGMNMFVCTCAAAGSALASLSHRLSDAERLSDGKLYREVAKVFFAPTPCPATAFGHGRKKR